MRQAKQIDNDIFENEISDASYPEEDKENEVDPRESSEFALKMININKKSMNNGEYSP